MVVNESETNTKYYIIFDISTFTKHTFDLCKLLLHFFFLSNESIVTFSFFFITYFYSKYM